MVYGACARGGVTKMPTKWAIALAAVAIAGGSIHSAAAADLRVISRADSMRPEPGESSDGIPEDSIAQVLPYKGDPAGIRRWLASHGIEYSLIYTNDVLSNLRGGLQRGTIDQGKLETTISVDAEKLLGHQGSQLLCQLLSNPQHRSHATGLRRWHQHHRGDRGGADDPAVRAVDGAEILGRHREHQAWATRGRRRVHLQRRRRAVPGERLADDHGGQSAERRTGLSAVHPRRAPEIRAQQARVVSAGGVQRRSGRAGMARRGAGSKSVRCQLPPAGPGLLHRRGAVQDQPGQDRHGTCQHVEVRRMGPPRRIRGSSLRE